jgi:TonB family protein
MINRCAIGLVTGVLASGAWAAASAEQDPLARAKQFYATAAYEEALQALDALRGKVPAAAATEVSAYQMLCLVALGRGDEAKDAIVQLVKTDPLYQPSEAEASPRVRALFQDVRRPLLPEVVRERYTKGRQAYDAKEMETAHAEFVRVLQILDEIGASEASVADLKTLAEGFRDLSRLAAVPPPAPPPPDPAPVDAAAGPPPGAPSMPAPPGGTPAAGAPGLGAVPVFGETDTAVKKPVPVAKGVPPWRPASPAEERQTYHGAVEVIVGEDGKVVAASLIKSVHPRYDAPLLEAVRGWTFKPATLGTVPVRYRYTFAMQLGGR